MSRIPCIQPGNTNVRFAPEYDHNVREKGSRLRSHYLRGTPTLAEQVGDRTPCILRHSAGVSSPETCPCSKGPIVERAVRVSKAVATTGGCDDEVCGPPCSLQRKKKNYQTQAMCDLSGENGDGGGSDVRVTSAIPLNSPLRASLLGHRATGRRQWDGSG